MHLKDGFSGIPDDLFGKTTRKCFFPYSYLDSFTKIQKPLPEFGESWRNSERKNVRGPDATKMCCVEPRSIAILFKLI